MFTQRMKAATVQQCTASTSSVLVLSTPNHQACSKPRFSVVRQSYETETDARPRAPDAGPGRWGAPPPPPPPPPPPQKANQGGAPSRREAMFGLLGAGLGVGFTTAFFKAQYPDDDAALEEALDALLDNPDFLDLVADEIMYEDYQADADEDNAAISRMRNALVNELDKAKQAEGR